MKLVKQLAGDSMEPITGPGLARLREEQDKTTPIDSKSNVCADELIKVEEQTVLVAKLNEVHTALNDLFSSLTDLKLKLNPTLRDFPVKVAEDTKEDKSEMSEIEEVLKCWVIRLKEENNRIKEVLVRTIL